LLVLQFERETSNELIKDAKDVPIGLAAKNEDGLNMFTDNKAKKMRIAALVCAISIQFCPIRRRDD
jgi:hypothetical protein